MEKGNEVFDKLGLNIEKKGKVSPDKHGYYYLPLAGKQNSIYQSLKGKDFKDYDIISIFVGVNDYKLNKPIVSKDSLESFQYCYDSMLKNIKKQNEKATIILLTPMKRGNFNYMMKTKNSAGLTLNDYRNTIMQLSKKYKTRLSDNSFGEKE